MVATPILSTAVSGNRGANGIDGQLSTFFGWRPQHAHSWALLGDLTTLYDLNAPWILPQQVSTSWTLAIMNNSGGQIFKPMFNRDAFLNRHSLNFEHWSKMWNLTYQCTDSLTEDFKVLPQVLEINPSEEQSEQLHQKLEMLWKTL
jgi:2-succinyl-5-enolpyruvyl-6-hydroxy-3-cyclohexene-1-carboxylate synthase